MADCQSTDCSIKVFDIIAALYVGTFRYNYGQIINGREDGGGTVDDTVVGAIYSDNSDLEQVVADICTIYQLERSYTADGMRIYRNEGIEEPNAIAAVIDASELAVTDTSADGINYAVSTTYGASANQPTQIAFNFLDADNDYKPNQLTAKRPDAIQTDQTQQITLPFVMHTVDAEKLVNRLLSYSKLTRIQHTFRLPPKYAWLGKGDIIQINHTSFADLVRITQTDFNADKSQSVTATTVGTTSQPVTAVAHDSQATVTGGPLVDSEGLILDIPAPLPADTANNAGKFEVYYGVLPKAQGSWQGGYLARQFPADSEIYATLFHVYGQPGKAGSVIQRWTANNKLSNKRWVTDSDTLTLVNPNAIYDVSQNTDKAHIDANPMLNLAVYGAPGRWELIQFEAVVDGVMSGIVRGLRGTEGSCGQHQNGDSVYLLKPGIAMVRYPAARLGQVHKYRAVSEGGFFLTAADILPPNLVGNSRRPFAPYHFSGVRAGNNDITFSWLRRDRSGNGWGHACPNSESQLAFSVKVCTASGALLRTLAATDTSIVYTSQMQSDDQAGGATEFQLQIAQVGDINAGFVGRENVHV